MSDDIAEVTSAEPPDDAQLAAAFAAGDDGAFEALYRRYARPVHDYVLGVVRNRSLAEDVTQNTFVRAYESRDALRDPAAFRGWLYRIAHNAAINQVTRTAPTDELGDDAPYASQAPGPEQLAEQDEAVRLVWDAAASLEPRQYAVLDLALRQGLTSAEIGTVLDLDNAQASLALHRAREALGNAVRYLVVARRRRHCDRLAELVPAGVRQLTPDQRATVDRHMRRCDDCRRVAQVLTAPGELFGLAPIAGLPLGLHEWRGWNTAATSPAPPAGGHPGPVGRGLRAVARHPVPALAIGAAVIAAVVTVPLVTGRHGGEPATAGPPTAVRTYEPWSFSSTGGAVPKQNLKVTDATGQCAFGSRTDPGRFDTAVCVTTDQVRLDPCFVNVASGAGSPVLCVPDPTRDDATLVHLTGQMDPSSAGPQDTETDRRAAPWVLVLDDGRTCTFVRGDRVSYACTGTLAIVDALDRSSPHWTVRQEDGRTVGIAAAYT